MALPRPVHLVRSRFASDVQPERYLRRAEPGVRDSHEVARGDQRRCALELLHSQQSQRVAHEDVDTTLGPARGRRSAFDGKSGTRSAQGRLRSFRHPSGTRGDPCTGARRPSGRPRPGSTRSTNASWNGRQTSGLAPDPLPGKAATAGPWRYSRERRPSKRRCWSEVHRRLPRCA